MTPLRNSLIIRDRRRKTDPVSDEVIGKLTTGLRRTNSGKIRNILAAHDIMSVSASTIRRRLKEQRIRHNRLVQDLSTELHKKMRVKWSENSQIPFPERNWPISDWFFKFVQL